MIESDVVAAIIVSVDINQSAAWYAVAEKTHRYALDASQ